MRLRGQTGQGRPRPDLPRRPVHHVPALTHELHAWSADQDPARSRSDPTRPDVRRAMQHAFPYRLEPTDRRHVIQFIDVPEAHTLAPTAAGAARRPCARLPDRGAGRLHQARPRDPAPEPGAGPAGAFLPPLVAAKLALYQAMRAAAHHPDRARPAPWRAGERRPPPARPRPPLAHRPDRPRPRRAKRLEVRVQEPA